MFTVWFTGLSGSGKTTLAEELTRYLKTDYKVEHLDGDEIRKAICKDLGFSKEDRDENVRRVAWLCRRFNQQGVVTIVSLISPYREARRTAREYIEHIGSEFIEVFCSCPLKVLRERDSKGLYKMHAEGKIQNLTGVDDPYEAPLEPDVWLDTYQDTVGKNASIVLRYFRFRESLVRKAEYELFKRSL